VVWVNESDHLQLIARDEAGDFKAMLALLHLAFEAVVLGLKRLIEADSGNLVDKVFAENIRLGVVTCCPSHIGSGMTASVRMSLPKLGRRNQAEAVLEVVRECRCRVSWVGGSAEVTHTRGAGVLEYELVRDVIECANLLAEREDELDHSTEDEAMQSDVPKDVAMQSDVPEDEDMQSDTPERIEKSNTEIIFSGDNSKIVAVKPQMKRSFVMEKSNTDIALVTLKPQVEHSALIEAVLRHESVLRRELLALPFMHIVLLSEDSVGPWILNLLDDPKVRDSVADYLVEASRVAEGDKQLVDALAKELGKLHNFLPRLLKLSDNLQERAVNADIVMQVRYC